MALEPLIRILERRAGPGAVPDRLRDLVPARLLLCGLTLWVAHAAKAEPAGGPLMQNLLACRARVTAENKAACFDAAVAAMAAAQASGELVILDQAQRRNLARQAFGFSIPSLQSLLPQDGRDETLSSPVVEVSRDAAARWVVTLENGQVWRQADASDFIQPPRPGVEARIRRASLGSFTMAFDGRPGARAERVR